ncbi:MAG TPA: radical SAM family heme chaperone HemW [Pyrinomonadaceae bacterium]|nr:radical SAM family heme chaperone HemW [Pyrinomonadaceae bacterium]
MAAGVYLHIPFCKSRCSYCDFATDVYRSGEAVERYVDALCFEIRNSKFEIQDLIDTIYFGGGTPSLLEPEHVETILSSVFSVFSVANDPEITLEMNPATVTPEKLTSYRELGVNRASFGVQTFNDRDLKLLARGHDSSDARETYRMLRDEGFENISFDLIAGLPGQSMEYWQLNLDEAIEMSPEHISLYLLEIHEATPLAEQIRSGRRTPIEDDLAAEMYEVMLDRLAASGYQQYEISNFARPGFESRHNTKYWRLDPVYGFGVAAHSFDGRERLANDRDTAKYVEMIEQFGSAETFREEINIASEAAFLGLRLNDGIDLHEFRKRFGIDLKATADDLIEKGLVELSGERLRLTRKGMLFSNEVFAEFV